MSLGRNASLVTSINILAQGVQLSALPAISTYAPPSSFGVFTIFVGLCAVASILAGLRYDAAIVVARRENSSRQVALLVCALGFATALCCLALVPPVLRLTTTLLWSEAYALASLAAIYVFSNSVLRIAVNWLTREGRFLWVGALQFLAVVAMVAAQLSFLRLDIDPALGLIGGFAVGQLLPAVVAFTVARRGARWMVALRRKRLFATARAFSSFPRYMILYGLNSTLRERAVHLLIGWGAGASALGQFAMVQRVVSAPHSFLHGGFGPALLSHARYESRPDVARAAAALMELAVVTLTPPFVFLAFNADAIVAALFSASWAGLGDYVRWLTLPYLVLASTAFIDRLFELYGQQREALKLDLLYGGVLMATLTLAATSGNGLILAATFGITYLVYEIFWTYRTFITNQLPLQALQRFALLAIAHLGVQVLVSMALLEVDSFWQRVAAAGVATVLLLAVHYRWLGGHRLVGVLFAHRLVAAP